MPNASALRYLAVINPGPVILIRVPEPLPFKWRGLLASLTKVMRSHGLFQKDIYAIENVLPEPDPEYEARLERAFAGDPEIIPGAWLYDLEGRWARLVREGSRR